MKLATLLYLAAAVGLPTATHAADAACQAIIDAGHAKLRAPTVHDINVMDAQSGQTGEFIKVGPDAWMKADRGWKKISPALLKTMQNAALDGLTMSDCKQVGSESLGGVATRIYSWTTVVNGKSYGSARVWIGSVALKKVTAVSPAGATTSRVNSVTAPWQTNTCAPLWVIEP
jgi:hypothetical protein